MTRTRSQAIISMLNVLVLTSTGQIPTFQDQPASRKHKYYLGKVAVNYSESLNYCPDRARYIDLRQPSYRSLLNLIEDYISTGIIPKSNRMWIGATRNVTNGNDFYWQDGQQINPRIHEEFSIVEFQFQQNFSCLTIKYSPILRWRLRVDDCSSRLQYLCDVPSDEACDLVDMGNVWIDPYNLTMVNSTTFLSDSFPVCEETCRSWAVPPDQECWIASYNTATGYCQILHGDVMPSLYQTCEMYTYTETWRTSRKVCYELKVFNEFGKLVPMPECLRFQTTSPQTTDIRRTTEPTGVTNTTSTGTTLPRGQPTINIGYNTDDVKMENCAQVCHCGEINSDLNEILNTLEVNLKQVSSYRRRYISVPDDRPLSVGLGWTGVVLLVSTVLAVFILDSQRLYHDIRTMWGNIKCLSPVQQP